jgi:hypothetical protein
MAISDNDQHTPFASIVTDGVTSIDSFNTWRKKTNGIIKVIDDGLITRYIADRAITPPKLSQGRPYWDSNGDFNTNGNNIKLGYARGSNINAYIGADRSADGVSSLFFQTERATSGVGTNAASIIRAAGASGLFSISNSGGGININTEGSNTTTFRIGENPIANFNTAGLAVTNEITAKNVKLTDVTPYYRLRSNSSGALPWNLESSGTRLYIRTGTTAITTTLELPGTAFSRSGTTPGNIVVVNAPNHGYATGSIATISGISPTDFRGTFVITNTGTNTFTYITPTTGTINGGTGTASISMLINPATPFQILNDNSVIVGGSLTSAARSGDEFTVLGDSYLSGSLTVTGSDTAIGHSIGSSLASLSIGINRTGDGSSAVKFYSSKTNNTTETASITRDSKDLIINSSGTGTTFYRQGTGGTHKLQIRSQNNTDWLDCLTLESSQKVIIPGTLKVIGGFDQSAPIPTISTAKRLATGFGDGVGTIVTANPIPGGADITTDYGSTQSYFKFGTSISQDYFLIVGGARTASDRTGILIRSHGPTGSTSINEWTPTTNTDTYNTDGLFIEKGSGLNGDATIYNSGTGKFTIQNRGEGDIQFVTTSSTTSNTVNRLKISGSTGAATFSNTVTATGFIGPLTGKVTGDLDGNVTGDLDGNVTGDVTGTLLTVGSGVTNRIKIDSNQIRVNGTLNINKTRTSGDNAQTAQDTIIYNGIAGEIAKFVGSTRSVVFSGDAEISPTKKLNIKETSANVTRARLQIGDWYIGQSSASNGTKDFYIATSDAATIASPRLLINANGKITGTITNADVAVTISGILPVTNGGTGSTNAADARAALGAAPLNSPTFTGTPKVTTSPASNSNDTTIATTAFVIGTTSAAIAANAPTKTGGGASGNWPINITGNATTATTATTAATCTGNAGSVTNGVYISTDQTIDGIKTFSKVVRLSDAGIMFNSDVNKNTGFTWSTEGAIDITVNNTVRGSFKNTGWNGNVVGNVDGNVTGYLTGSISGSSASCSGNSATATNLSTVRTNWATNGTLSAVVGQLGWRHYGNNHTIFDASNSKSPDGTTINNKDAAVAWTGTYPTLMGWNGSQTYGVRVDSARVSDSCSGNSATATSAAYATNAGNSSTTNQLSTTGLTTNGNQINPGSSGELALTYQNSNGTTADFYDTSIFDGKQNLITKFHGNGGLQYNVGDIVINNANPTLYLQDTNHRSAMVRVNGNIFHILRGGANSTTWNNEGVAWPLEINLNNNWATFGGNITANGAIRATSDIIAFSSSDKNLKTNIKKIKDPLQKIAQLSGNTFKWNSKKQDVYEGEDVGVIAQEVEEIIPSAVVTREDGTKAVRYEKIIPLLIESIKELHALNSTLFGRIEQLEKQLK